MILHYGFIIQFKPNPSSVSSSSSIHSISNSRRSRSYSTSAIVDCLRAHGLFISAPHFKLSLGPEYFVTAYPNSLQPTACHCHQPSTVYRLPPNLPSSSIHRFIVFLCLASSSQTAKCRHLPIHIHLSCQSPHPHPGVHGSSSDLSYCADSPSARSTAKPDSRPILQTSFFSVKRPQIISRNKATPKVSSTSTLTVEVESIH